VIDSFSRGDGSLAVKKKVAVVGARGYSGLELCRLLLSHPGAQLEGVYTRTPQWCLVDDLLMEGAQTVPNLAIEELVASPVEIEVIFLATPAEVSQQLVVDLQRVYGERMPKIIDLSGGFRLDSKEYHSAYAREHLAPSERSVYGLVPWQDPDCLRQAQVIANPGCYATSVLMALLPLVKEGLIEPQRIVIDAKSGTTGAGRNAKEGLLMSELFANFFPYKVGEHQHEPEIVKYVRHWTDVHIDLQFTTHLLPVDRGILSSIYGRMTDSTRSTCTQDSDRQISDLFKRAYGRAYEDYPLVEFTSLNEVNKNLAGLALKKIVNTPLVRIYWLIKDEKFYAFSLIDNLLKGAASQAVENFNIINNWPVDLGLLGGNRGSVL
jgi:N-acetyl-gamma-glutamyl-phosphate reductase